MGSKERQDRDREAVRNRILTAARELFVSDGYRNVSMRKIAERIEYSAAAIYGYFPSKDDIFFALAEEGFALMSRDHERSVAGEPDPLQAVRAMFLAYHEFARQQPQYFELMFVDRSGPRLAEQWERFPVVIETMNDAIATVQRAIDAGAFPPETDALAAFHVLWAAAHGPATIALCNRLSPDEDGDALARDVVDAAIAGLQAGTRLTFVPECPHGAGRPSDEKEHPHVVS
jgi:AcrR family transcriptional regulator